MKYLPAIYTRVSLCAHCGKVCMFHGKSGLYCSSACKKRAKNRRKRRDYGQCHVDIVKLFRRYRGRCALCGGYCLISDFTEKDGHLYPGPNYPTIDHIIPRSKGGKNSYKNAQLAHYRCNQLKKDFYEDN